MATGGQEKGSVPDYDECPVCRECLRDPRTLNCGHYICTGCIEGLVRENPQGPIKCPSCREVTQLPEGSGVTDLPQHEGKYSFEDQVVGFLSGADKKTITSDCELCEERGVQATSLCFQCTIHICKVCEGHHLEKTTSHTIVPLVDLLYCSTHPNRVLNMYCDDCTVNICMQCALHEHDTHNTVDIDGVAKQSRQRLQDFVESQSAIDDYQNTLDHVMSALGEARKREIGFTDSINNTRRLLKELEANLDQVERDTKNKLTAEMKLLSLYETDIKDMIDSRKSLIDHATYLVEQASDPELVEREKDFPRTTVRCIQNIDNVTINLPETGNTFTIICGRLERMFAAITVAFRKWNIGKSKILEIEDLQKQHTVAVGYNIHGVTMDTKRQRIVARTSDHAGPLKVYNYKGELQESLGAGVTELAGGSNRGICMDTKRDIYLAPCQNTLVLVDRAGQQVTSITVGSNNTGIAYHKEVDSYLVSAPDKYTVYLINANTFQVTSQIGSKRSGSTQLTFPYNIHMGTVAGIDRPCIIVSDYGNHCIKLYDISLTHVKTYGSDGSGDKQLNRPWGVCTDARGRVVVADRKNKQVVSYWTDGEGREQWEYIIGNDYEGNDPRHLAIDTDNTVMAIVDSTFKALYIYN